MPMSYDPNKQVVYYIEMENEISNYYKYIYIVV